MSHYRSKGLKIFGSLVAIIFLLLGFVVNSQVDRQNLEVDFLNVGQGDAILIKTPAEQNILIDGGPSKAVLSELGENLAFFDKELDLVILTHPHADHVDGLVEVLRRYQVKKILMTGVLHPSPDYQIFLEEIKQQNIPVEYANGQRDINLAQDLVLKILYPWADLNGKEVENLNNSSIITKLIYKEKSFLFMGDAEELAEQDLAASQIDLEADVLKIGHHGSKYSSSQNFLEKVKPLYAVILVGTNNDFGHPHLKTLKLLEQLGINILRTDLEGTIKIISDGSLLKIKARD